MGWCLEWVHILSWWNILHLHDWRIRKKRRHRCWPLERRTRRWEVLPAGPRWPGLWLPAPPPSRWGASGAPVYWGCPRQTLFSATHILKKKKWWKKLFLGATHMSQVCSPFRRSMLFTLLPLPYPHTQVYRHTWVRYAIDHLLSQGLSKLQKHWGPLGSRQPMPWPPERRRRNRSHPQWLSLP